MGSSNKTILIVDDEKRIQDIYIRTFLEAGFLVRWASSAQEAMNIMVREKIDLVLLDIKMPRINGQTLYDVIQEYDPNTKVIVSSVYPVEKQKLMIPQAQDYYDKSQSSLILLEKVKNAIA